MGLVKHFVRAGSINQTLSELVVLVKLSVRAGTIGQEFLRREWARLVRITSGAGVGYTHIHAHTCTRLYIENLPNRKELSLGIIIFIIRDLYTLRL